MVQKISIKFINNMKKIVNYDVVDGLEGMKNFLESNKVAKRVFDNVKQEVYHLISLINKENILTGVTNDVNDGELDFETGVRLWMYMRVYFGMFSKELNIEVNFFGEKVGEYGFEIIVMK